MSCEKIINGVQCDAPTSPDEKFCRKHKTKKTTYALRYLADEVREKVSSPEFLSLKEEVAMTRTVVEKIWNNCHSDSDLAANAGLLSKLFEQVEKLVSASHKMDVINGSTISEEGIKKIFEQIQDILTEEIDDSETLERISSRFIDLISKIQK